MDLKVCQDDDGVEFIDKKVGETKAKALQDEETAKAEAH